VENNYFIDILELLAGAVIAIPLFHRLGLGSVLGYLIAGVVLGPWGLEFIVKVAEIRHFAEFGVIFLLFLIGIEMKPERLWVMRRWVFGLGLAQLLVTGTVLTALALAFQLPLKTAIIVGYGLALSSTAFGLQTLAEKGGIVSILGRTSFSVLLLQDLAVVPLMLLVSLLAEGIPLNTSVGGAILEAFLAIIVVIISGRYLLNPLLDRIAASRNSEVFVAAVVLLVLSTAKLMELVGLPMALGAFLAGLMLAESHYRHQIEADIQPFRGILLGLFFMAVGMSIDFGHLLKEATLIVGLVFSLIFIKTTLLWILCRFSGINSAVSLRVALLLSQAGEFGLVLFGGAMLLGVIKEPLFQTLTLVIALSMAIAPLIIKLGDFWAAHIEKKTKVIEAVPDITEATKDHVILAGFGRVGQRIAYLMHSSKISFVALDYNHKQVTKGKIDGFPVYYANASHLNVLKAAGAERARMLIITIDNADHAEKLVENVRQHFPLLPIHVRGHDYNHCEALLLKGADSAVSENLEASLRLAELVLRDSGLNAKNTIQLLDDYRHEYYHKLKKVIKHEIVEDNKDL
jgi:monovalent cation:proton antiporter-2 (CPA2) family protein